MALAWALLFFAGLQFTLNSVVDRWWVSELYDPEFTVRHATLLARIAEHPERPLLLLLGSSRTEMGFLPERLPRLETSDGRTVLPFNFSHLAGGPAMNLMELRRLLKKGIHPEWLVIEIAPPLLADEKQQVIIDVAGPGELGLAKEYRGAWATYYRFGHNRLVPWYKHRMFVLKHTAPCLLPPEARLEIESVALGPLGGDYGWQAKSNLQPEVIEFRQAVTRAGYVPVLENFEICPIVDRAMNDLLGLCRQVGIRAALLLTPEATEFRNWYSPESLRDIQDFCSCLSKRYQVPVVDARQWLGDQDFADYHHPLIRGAEAFTRRLGCEMLEPWVRGRLGLSHAVAEPAPPANRGS
jgi:hypothetical protein